MRAKSARRRRERDTAVQRNRPVHYLTIKYVCHHQVDVYSFVPPQKNLLMIWFFFIFLPGIPLAQNGWKEGGNNVSNDQSLAAQLQEVKHQTSSGPVVNTGASTIKEQLKRVFEKLRLQIVEEFLEVSWFLQTLNENACCMTNLFDFNRETTVWPPCRTSIATYCSSKRKDTRRRNAVCSSHTCSNSRPSKLNWPKRKLGTRI